MDFRDPDATVIQTPRTGFTVYSRGGGCYSVVLHLDALNPLHAAFAQRIREAEAAVRSKCKKKRVLDIDTCRQTETEPEFRSCFSDTGTLMLSAFLNTEYFDSSGAMIHGPSKPSKACACLLELKPNSWSKDSVYGAKIGLVQMKFYESVPSTPPAFIA